MEREWLARRLAEGGSYEAIAREAGCSASKVSYWAGKYGLQSSHTTRHAAKGAIPEDVLVSLVERGASIRQIAAEVNRSPTAVRHRLKRLGLTTLAGVGIAEGAAARAAGEREPILTCPVHS